MIATKRSDFVACQMTTSLRDLVAGNSEKFSYMPVVQQGSESEHVVGVVHLEPYFETPPPEKSVGEAFERLSEKYLIGADASILSFVLEADLHPFRLLVSDNGIIGLVSLSDLQKLPVRAALFGLVTELEIAMTEAIRAKDPDQMLWPSFMSEGRRSSMESRIKLARSTGGIVDELLYTEFCDKRDILMKLLFRDDPRRAHFVKNLKQIESLRNHLAHANDYADNNERSAGVCSVVRDIISILNILRPNEVG
ncbi:hypothetical protein [Mesorhizobium sp. B1-1-7]|uniref:hypothetical protein n=1 Tax=Mesorhizobium sp. B1-1-7 TaxID=2589977 RepID=UPI0015E340AE|nr:hypothetical protein [Mesorhizobium sp. B1-1-7]